jgi:hypothetical protein
MKLLGRYKKKLMPLLICSLSYLTIKRTNRYGATVIKNSLTKLKTGPTF